MRLTFLTLLIFGLAAPGGAAEILAGGYMDGDQNGSVVWMGFATDASGAPLAELPLYYDGLPVGIAAVQDAVSPNTLRLALPGLPGPAAYLVQVGAWDPFGSTAAWPYLTVQRDRPPVAKPLFRNIAEETDLKAYGYPSTRIAWYDMDGDGWLDVLVDKDKVLLSRPKPGGGRHFIDHTDQAGLHGITNANGDERESTVTVMADIDNDGDLDAYSGLYLDFRNAVDPTPDHGFRSAIYLNDGNAVFTEVPNSGVGGNPGTEVPAGFVDYDNDGCLDLLVGYFYINYGGSYAAYPNRLYRGHCDGTFTDVTDQAGMLTTQNPNNTDSSRPTYGLTTMDYDNDGDQDIFWAVYGRQRNYHWRNNGDGTFTDVAAATTFDGDGIRNDSSNPWFRQNGNSFAAQGADFNNDGIMDLVLSEITHAWAGDASDLTMLLRGNGPDQNWTFERGFFGSQRPRTGQWNQGDIHAGWIDFDMDRRQDLLIASGDYPDGQFLQLFEQTTNPFSGAPGWFRDQTDMADFNWESSAAISVGDFDRDGDPDLLAGRSLMRMPREKREAWGVHGALFENLVGTRNNGVTIRLRGKGQGHANRLGIGARITVTANGETTIHEISGACGHAGQMNAFEASIGLGDATVIDEVTVRWPNAGRTTQTWTGLQANRIYTLVEDEPVPVIATP